MLQFDAWCTKDELASRLGGWSDRFDEAVEALVQAGRLETMREGERRLYRQARPVAVEA